MGTKAKSRFSFVVMSPGARSGPDTLAREPFCLGINDPLDMRPAMPGACAASSGGLNPFVFTLFRGWTVTVNILTGETQYQPSCNAIVAVGEDAPIPWAVRFVAPPQH